MLKLNIENVAKLVFNVNLKSVRIYQYCLFFFFSLSCSSSYCVVGNAFNVVYYSFLFLSWLRFMKIFVMCSFVTMKFRWFIEINAKRESTGRLRSVRRFTCCCCCCCSLWILFDQLDIRKAQPIKFYCECF